MYSEKHSSADTVRFPGLISALALFALVTGAPSLAESPDMPPPRVALSTAPEVVDLVKVRDP